MSDIPTFEDCEKHQISKIDCCHSCLLEKVEQQAAEIERLKDAIEGDGRCSKCFEYNEQKRCACERLNKPPQQSDN